MCKKGLNKMSKLRYFYGTMASAKSSNLLMKVYQFEQSGSKCLLLKPSIDTRIKNKINCLKNNKKME